MKVLKYYWPTVKKYKWWFVVMLIAMILKDVCDFIYPLFIKNIADLFTGSAEENYPKAIEQLYFVMLFMFLNYFFGRIFYYTIIKFELKGMHDLYQKSFKAIQSHSYDFFINSFAGSLVKKVNRFVDAFENITDNIFFNFLRNIIQIVFVIIVFFINKPVFGYIFFIWTIIFVITNLFYCHWQIKYDLISATADSKISATLADSFSNFSTVKIFAAENAEQKKFKNTTDDWQEKTYQSWIFNYKFDVFQIFFMVLLEGILLYLSLYWWKQNSFTIGDLMLFQTYLLLIFSQIWAFGRNIRNLFRDLANAQEMADIFEQKIEIKDTKNAKALKIAQGEIEFKNVNFTHNSGTEVFKNFSLKIKANEKIALVGQSGAGKTTIVSLLFRFYDLQKGQILIDGQDISKITQESLHQNISLVPQDPNLFHRTIAENIAYGNPKATKEDIIKAAKKAKAHDFIKNLKDGYDTFVGERGVKLSGGERQRIAIARIILENSKILVFDEATSALDSSTEKEIQEAMEEVMKNRTTIIIAHRLSTVKKADRVIVIDDGEIIEQGKHDYLLSKKGKYAELWSHQVGGFLADE